MMNKEFPLTTLLYIEDGDSYMMIHRIKRGDGKKYENDINKDKWLGIGGHIEAGESPEDCILRETMEEAGIIPLNLRKRGIVTFVQGDFTEYMFLFTAIMSGESKKALSDKARNCEEGEFAWVKKGDVYSLPIWEGDKIFFKLLEEDAPYFSLKLVYEGDKLVESELR